MLYKLSLKNIKKSFKDYAIYFVTLLLGVAIFYVFNAIEKQTVLLNVTEYTNELIDLMVEVLSVVSVFVSFILGFLIIYASRFLIKRRNKEFGIYLTLGMSKRKISTILLIETIIIGFLSLIVGLIVGILLSQLMSVFVANMFEADMTKFTFVVSSNAIIKTIIYFGIMYLLVMIFNTISVGKCKLIDLLYSSKKTEKIKLKNPALCIVVFLVALTALAYAYWCVSFGVEYMQDVGEVVIPIILGCISTFLIFWSLSGFILKIVSMFKNTYFKGLNNFTIRQLSSKINTTIFSMTIICLMLFFTISVLSISLSVKNAMTANLQTLAPVDIEISKTINLTEEEATEKYGYSTEIVADSNISLMETLENLNFDVDTYLTDVTNVYVYLTESFTSLDSFGDAADSIINKYSNFDFDSEEVIMTISDYNKVAKLYGNETFTLEDDEYLVVADYEGWITIRNQALEENASITISGKTYYPKYSEVKNGFLNISSNYINTGIFIVPDDAVDDSLKAREFILANYKASDDKGKEAIEEIVNQLENEPYLSQTMISISTKLDIYEGSVGLGAFVTFIGLYLGIIFLISSAAILALKELSESTDNKERFNMLRKLGADEKMINRALFKQIGLFFLFPLVLAIIHSIFGIYFSNYILSTFGDEELLKSIIMTAIFLVIIYGSYFFITYFCSKNIIKD